VAARDGVGLHARTVENRGIEATHHESPQRERHARLQRSWRTRAKKRQRRITGELCGEHDRPIPHDCGSAVRGRDNRAGTDYKVVTRVHGFKRFQHPARRSFEQSIEPQPVEQLPIALQ